MNKKRLLEIIAEKSKISARKLEIRKLIDTEGADLEAIKTELAELELKSSALVNEEAQIEERGKIVEKLNFSTDVEVRTIVKEEAKKEDNIPEKKSMAFRNYIKTGSVVECRALQMDSPTAGGYLVAPEQFVNELITSLNNSLFFRQISKVLPPLKGSQSLGYPRRTSAMARAVHGSEIGSPTADTTMAFGKREFKPKPMTAEILVSKTLINNAPQVDSLVRSEFEFAFGERQEMDYMTGDGTNCALGVFTASDDGISTARDVSTGNTATEVKFDGLINAEGLIKNQYRKNLSWIFHRDVVTQIRKLKDANGQYIWQQSVLAGTPSTLLGYPVYISEYAPNTFTTGQYIGILGDFSQYWIADSEDVEVQALMELMARTNQVDYIARASTDGAPVVEEAFARLKLA